ncbi:MAG: heme NO-binding domain-containing protein [Gemmatimonadaceae bacterium]
MHGLIVNQLRQYVVGKAGRDTWQRIATVAGISTDGPPAISAIYPDETVLAAIAAATADTGIARNTLLEDFGAFLAGGLLRVYGTLLDSDWRTLDVIEHTEAHIHTAVRRTDPNAAPPRLSVRRDSPEQATILYASPRRLCAVAEGITRGLAEHFREAVNITQTSCMERGDGHCLIRVHLVSRP